MPATDRVEGFCHNNDDPAKAGRIEVTIPEMDGDVYPYWIDPIFPAGEWVAIPEVGDSVELELPAGVAIVEYPTNVKYLGKRLTDATPVPHEFQTHYPSRRGCKTKGGHLLIFDDSSGNEEVTLSHKGTLLISLTNDGIFFGTQSASEPMVLGNLWKTMMETLLASYKTHTHPTGVGPSGPPSDAAIWDPGEKAKLPATISDFIFGQKTQP